MSIKIHGNEYITVAERVKEFRAKYPQWQMLDEVIAYNDTTITIKTTIYDDKCVPVATGIAREEKNESNINETSFVENCETSAWGRALANLGIGIDSEVASADELVNALGHQQAQTQTKSKYQQVADLLPKANTTMESVNKWIKNKFNKECRINDLTDSEFQDILDTLKARVQVLTKDTGTEEETSYGEIPF